MPSAVLRKAVLILSIPPCLSIFYVNATSTSNSIYVDSYGATANGSTDSTEAIRKALVVASQLTGPTEVIFSAGTYRIDCVTPINGFCFNLQGYKNLSLRGQGSNTKLLISNPVAGLASVFFGKDIRLTGFEVDYRSLPFTQGKITKVINLNSTEQYIDLNVEAGYPKLDQPIFSPSYLSQTFGMLFSATSPRLKGSAGGFYLVKSISKRTESSYRLKLSSLNNIAVGDRFALPNRSRQVFHFQNSENLTLKQVSLFAGPGAASIWVRNNGKIVIDGFRVLRKPDTTRLLSTAADAIHMLDNRAQLTIQNCYIEGMGDDAINIRSDFFPITHLYNTTTFQINNKGVQFKVGDSLQILNPVTQEARGYSRIKSIQLDNNLATITLYSPIPGLLNTDLIFNAELASKYALIKKNIFSNFRGLFRIRSSGALFVGNSVLDSRNAKVLIAADITDAWKEGPSLVSSLNGIYFDNNFVSNGKITLLGTKYSELGTPPLSGSKALLGHPLLYQPDTYRSLNPDLAGMTNSQLLSHFINNGLSEGRRGSISFRAPEYLRLHADLAGMNYLSAANHFLINGAIYESRQGSIVTHRLVYDSGSYRGFNPDLIGMPDEQIGLHWLLHGINEGRRASNEFYSRTYLNRYPDLKAAFGSTNFRATIEHFVLRGYAEGRIGN